MYVINETYLFRIRLFLLWALCGYMFHRLARHLAISIYVYGREHGERPFGQQSDNKQAAMPQFETKRRVRHSASNMFELVADVERYPEFVPLCEKLKIISRETNGTGAETDIDAEIIVATMTVAYKLFRESFTSRITLDRKKQEIRVTYLDGPFRFLENRWAFSELEDDVCEVGFLISYEHRSHQRA